MSRSKVRRPRPQPARFTPRVKVWLETDGCYAFGLGISEILQAVDTAGSIKGVAAQLGKSYRHVWTRVKEAEQAIGRPLVEARVGGKGSRRSSLTAEARQLVTDFMALRKRMIEIVWTEFARLFR
jgi:molybdate transport system regulatory protein